MHAKRTRDRKKKLLEDSESIIVRMERESHLLRGYCVSLNMLSAEDAVKLEERASESKRELAALKVRLISLRLHTSVYGCIHQSTPVYGSLRQSTSVYVNIYTTLTRSLPSFDIRSILPIIAYMAALSFHPLDRDSVSLLLTRGLRRYHHVVTCTTSPYQNVHGDGCSLSLLASPSALTR